MPKGISSTGRSHNFKDLTGHKYGYLKVTNQYEIRRKNNKNNVFWLCECDCGGKIFVSNCHLRTGHTISCGCYSRNKGKLSPGESSFNELFYTYKRNAFTRNIEFYLTKDEFKWFTQQNCFYCGISPSNIFGDNKNNGKYIYNGIDRIDSNQPYIRDNCVSACTFCNKCKGTLSEEEFLNHINRIYKHNNK